MASRYWSDAAKSNGDPRLDNAANSTSQVNQADLPQTEQRTHATSGGAPGSPQSGRAGPSGLQWVTHTFAYSQAQGGEDSAATADGSTGTRGAASASSASRASEYGSTIKSLYRTLRRLWSSDNDFENSLQNSRSSRPVEPKICLDLTLHSLDVSPEDPSASLPLDYGLLPPNHLLATPAYLRHTESFSTGPPLEDAKCYIVDSVAQSVRMSLVCQTQREYLQTEILTTAPSASQGGQASASATTAGTDKSSSAASGGGKNDPTASASFTASDLDPSSSRTGLRILVFGPQSLARARRLVSIGDPLIPVTYSALTRHGKIFNSGVYWTDDISVVADVEPSTFDAILWFDSMLPLLRIAKMHAEALEKALENGASNPQEAHLMANQIISKAQSEALANTIATLHRVLKPGGSLAGTALFAKGPFLESRDAVLQNPRLAAASEQGNTLYLTTDTVHASLYSSRDALAAFGKVGSDLQVFTDLALEGRIVVHLPSQMIESKEGSTTSSDNPSGSDVDAPEAGDRPVLHPSPYADFQTALLRSGRVQAIRMLAMKPLEPELEHTEFPLQTATQYSAQPIVAVTSANVSPRHACVLSIAYPYSGAVASSTIPHAETAGAAPSAQPSTSTPSASELQVSGPITTASPPEVSGDQKAPETLAPPTISGAAAPNPAGALVKVAGAPITTRPRGLSASLSSPNLVKMAGDDETESVTDSTDSKPIDIPPRDESELPDPPKDQPMTDPTEAITASGGRLISPITRRAADLELLPPPLTHILSNSNSISESIDPFAPVSVNPPVCHSAVTPIPPEVAVAANLAATQAAQAAYASAYQAALATAASRDPVEPLRIIRRDRLAISGISIGLPNDDAIYDVVSGNADLSIPPRPRSVFDKSNMEALLQGTNFLQRISQKEKQEIRAKNPFMLVTKEGKRLKKYLTTDEQLLGVESKLGRFDLVEEYGVPSFVVEALDITFQYAIAAGLEALQDAGIPVLGKDSQGRPVVVPLPRSVAEDTGIIFASSFPGLDSCVQEVSMAVAHQTRQEVFELLKQRHNAELAQRCAIKAAEAELEANQESKEEPTPYSIALKELESAMAGPLYEYNRKLLFRVLVMANSQLAELIRARGPNTQINAACAGTSQAIAVAEDWIRAGRCSRVVVVSADTATSDRLLPYIGTGFLVLGAASIVQDPLEAAAPFDLRRKGMILGAGAVGLVLEKYSSVRARHSEMVKLARKYATTSEPNRPHGVPTLEEALAWKPKAELLGSHVRNSAFHASLIDGDHVSSEMHQFFTLMERIHGRRLYGADLAPSTNAYLTHTIEKISKPKPASPEGQPEVGDAEADGEEEENPLAWMHAPPESLSSSSIAELLQKEEAAFEPDTITFVAPKPSSAQASGAPNSCQNIEATPPTTPFDNMSDIRKLRRSRIARQLIYIAHETGTASCAKVESRALHDSFGSRFKQQIIMCNTKGFTGHPMAVSFEDVMAVGALHHSKVPPIANLRNPDPALGKILLSQGGSHDRTLALRFAAGFGSQFVILLFRKYLAPLNALTDAQLHDTLPKSLPGVGELDPELESLDYDEVPSELIESLSATAAKAAQRAALAASPVRPPGSVGQALRLRGLPRFYFATAGSPADMSAAQSFSGVPSAASSFSGAAVATTTAASSAQFALPPYLASGSPVASFNMGPEGAGAYYSHNYANPNYGYGSIAGSVAGSVSSMSNGPTSPLAQGINAIDQTPPGDQAIQAALHRAGVAAGHRHSTSGFPAPGRTSSQRGAFGHMDM